MDEWAIVLEDDVNIEPRFAEELEGVLADRCLDDADIVYLGHGHAAPVDDSDIGVLVRAEFAYCTHALLISLLGARRILEHFVPLVWPVDHHYVFGVSQGVLNGYLCRPEIVHTNDLSDDSIINNEP